MLILARRHLRRASTVAVFAVSAAFLAACASPTPKVSGKKRPKEYFAESEYGVKASPRVTNKLSNLPRGGGRDQLGQPYMVRGKMYYPKEDKKYKAVGLASWYGDAFHGRLTANGEIYDQTHLTAAHPTMPLPSYARVTNTETGTSVIVRVNDRGPYSDGRVIDLSRRAAEMLDYMHGGTANVKVEYVGRAPLEGNDDQFLLASYRPGNKVFDPSDGLPTGVMVAMNGPTPSAKPATRAPAFAPTMTDAPPNVPFGETVAFSNIVLPEFGPIVPQRPTEGRLPFQMASMSYADERVTSAAAAFAAIDSGRMSAADVAHSWKRLNPNFSPAEMTEAYIAVGTYESKAQASHIAKSLSAVGKVKIETSTVRGSKVYAVNLFADGHASLDDMLEKAWASGAADAMTVRN
ncbi:septal ring lytic transglycosylase RlpA family protein [Pseudaminobacter soli (ex Li et al. 2025)]|uniref:Endolytic peptidoglycan transglycosylase RlpA n=1 Tax=Pseudaminobacter soli (ex Li et al. 2025) TaxID=1295366 RepID=A0A2P7SP57_9HYPH|nr:septal ring lytic transglycosylase RlpA family protein [Mesorhizobium soli]PSJ64191.1 septal ring lytic transglycosylase RlpA family protein [Mesorhizobium soli]